MDVVNTTELYSVYFTSKDIISGTGTILGTPIQISFNNGGSGFGMPRSCPSGFIPVPGNKDFNQPGFCISKYTMTYSDADIPDSNVGGTDWNTIHYVPWKAVVSVANKFPIADITQPQAIAACQSLGTGYHLITENEWMAIARDIEATGDNWSTGISGSGWIYRGITGDENSATSLGCATANSTGAGPRNYVAKPLSTDTTKFGMNKGSDCDSKRQFKLSNGQIIWDVAGNLWSHVNKGNTIDGSFYDNADSWKSDACSGVNTWASFYGNDGGVAACVYSNNYSYANIGPKIPNLNSNNGIGYIHSYSTASNIFIRGGASAAGVKAGVFALRLTLDASAAGFNIGFRCAR